MFYQDKNDGSLTISAPHTTVTNNIFESTGWGIGISNTQHASYNTISNNTFINYATAVWLGAIAAEASYNNVSYNTLTDNEVAIRIYSGDLNSVFNNTINYTGGLRSREANNYGFDLVNSENNIAYDNQIDLQNNYWDEGYNLYCFSGQNNTYNFNITGDCQGDCTKPECPEVIDEGGDWGGGGGLSSATDPFNLLDTNSNSERSGWTPINIEGAIEDRLLYHEPSESTAYRYWIVHTLDTTMNVDIWAFNHQYLNMMASKAKVLIRHKNGDTIQYVNLKTSLGWIDLGNYEFDDNGLQGVAVFPNKYGYTMADAVRIESIA